MKRKYLPLVICIIGVASFILVFTLKSRSSALPVNPSVIRSITARPPVTPPEHIAYLFLFRTNSDFRNAASKAGRPKAINPLLLKEAKLNQLQTRKLDEITESVLQEVEQQDARARVVIEKFRTQYPNGIVPRGEKLAEPPPELMTLQQERNAIILRGRDRLRAALGEEEFTRFHEFVMKRFAGKGLFVREGQ